MKSVGGLEAVVASLLAALDPPAVVVTAAAGARRGGCLVTFSTQCSMAPFRFLVCLSTANATFGVAQAAAALAVNLPPRHDRALLELFGARTGDDVDKLDQVGWRAWEDGTPLLDGCGWFVGPVVSRHDVGDHVAMVLEPVAASPAAAAAPRLADVRHIRPGHSV
jgi:flavin reductase (DIM6/NTAB) family NADH-FMN oxidoreductase RutF